MVFAHLPEQARISSVGRHLLPLEQCIRATACPSAVCLSELPKSLRLFSAVPAVLTALRRWSGHPSALEQGSAATVQAALEFHCIRLQFSQHCCRQAKSTSARAICVTSVSQDDRVSNSQQSGVQTMQGVRRCQSNHRVASKIGLRTFLTQTCFASSTV